MFEIFSAPPHSICVTLLLCSLSSSQSPLEVVVQKQQHIYANPSSRIVSLRSYEQCSWLPSCRPTLDRWLSLYGCLAYGSGAPGVTYLPLPALEENCCHFQHVVLWESNIPFQYYRVTSSGDESTLLKHWHLRKAGCGNLMKYGWEPWK